MTDLHTRQFSHVGGTGAELLDRFAVSEICKGWPVYRDASEWANYRSLFTDDAYVWTSPAPNILFSCQPEPNARVKLTLVLHIAWSGPQPIEDFIRLSISGKERGAFIMHRECGTLVELSPKMDRAIGKMKAIITQRFKHPEGFEYEVDCDCRFMFFYEKTSDAQRHDWKVVFVKLVYEKDKVVPVDGKTVPFFAEEVLAKYPVGYKYLGAAQNTLGYEIDLNLVTAQNVSSCEQMYRYMERWLEGPMEEPLKEPAGSRSFRPV